IFQANRSIFVDESTVGNATFSDLNLEYFTEFLSDNYDVKAKDEQIKRYLKNLHLIDEKNHPTLSGLLFFGKKPQYFVPSAKIICAFIRGTDLAIPPEDKKEINGRVLDVLEDTQKFIRLYLKEEHHIKGFEPETKFEIPQAALREALVNAVAHRDYTINSPIRVIIFENRVEVRTPGKLPNTVTIESIKIGGSHVLRNPTIYNLLSKYGMVTDLGSGVRRILKLVKDNLNKKVTLIETDNEFVLILPRRSK
ncbi:MAG: ATP-binding protein, partial [bacterium]